MSHIYQHNRDEVYKTIVDKVQDLMWILVVCDGYIPVKYGSVWMMLASRIQQVVFCMCRMTEWRIISPIWTFLPPDTDLTMVHRLYFWAILTCMYYIVKLGYLLLGAINFFASIKIHPYILSTGTKYPFLLRG